MAGTHYSRQRIVRLLTFLICHNVRGHINTTTCGGLGLITWVAQYDTITNTTFTRKLSLLSQKPVCSRLWPVESEKHHFQTWRKHFIHSEILFFQAFSFTFDNLKLSFVIGRFKQLCTQVYFKKLTFIDGRNLKFTISNIKKACSGAPKQEHNIKKYRDLAILVKFLIEKSEERLNWKRVRQRAVWWFFKMNI